MRYLPIPINLEVIMRFLVFLILMIFSSLTLAIEKMPCSYVLKKIEVDLSYGNESLFQDYSGCISSNRVCYIDSDGIGSIDLIYKMSYGDPAYHVIVQSGKNDENPVCLIALSSGGSSAAWIFSAYEIIDEEALEIEGMDPHGNGEFPAKGAAEILVKKYQNAIHQ